MKKMLLSIMLFCIAYQCFAQSVERDETRIYFGASLKRGTLTLSAGMWYKGTMIKNSTLCVDICFYYGNGEQIPCNINGYNINGKLVIRKFIKIDEDEHFIVKHYLPDEIARKVFSDNIYNSKAFVYKYREKIYMCYGGEMKLIYIDPWYYVGRSYCHFLLDPIGSRDDECLKIGYELFNDDRYSEAYAYLDVCSSDYNDKKPIVYTLLGLCAYKMGMYPQAETEYTCAAIRGEELAQTELGKLYFSGLGVKQNYSEAFKWFEKAASQGNHNAIFFLGLCYFLGRGTYENDVKAKELFQKAAKNNNEMALHILGLWPERESLRELLKEKY